MDKTAIIEWLAGYINPPGVQDEDAGTLTLAFGIEPEEAQEMIAECEARLIKMFDTWKDDILKKNEKQSMKVSPDA